MAAVLIVEDDADSREVLLRLLQRAGHRAFAVPDGREALAAACEFRPDLVLLDIMMPQMDGPSFLTVFRSYHRWQHVPVIVLTATSWPQLDERRRKWDVKAVLRKADYTFAGLLDLVNEAVVPAALHAGSAAPVQPCAK